MDVKKNGEVSFWYADIGGVPGYRPGLPGDQTVDVCIIGAGFTGLWTAYYLKEAEPGLSIAVVEKEFAGYGASGRNGGWCSGEFGWSKSRYLSSGTKAEIIDWARQLRTTVAEVKRVTEKEGIDCDFLMTDCLTFAQSPAQMARLRDSYNEAMDWQVPTSRLEMIDGAEAASRIKIADSHGALVRHDVARVQPAKLVRGLAEAVARKGVAIYEQTTVTGISPGRVETNRGVVTAKKIIRATEGYTHGIKGNERALLPMNSAILVTEPLSDKLWAEIGWEGSQLLADGSHAYCYAQRTREGRIAMGGRGVPYRYGSATDQRGETQAETVEKLKAILYRMLPQTKGVALDHVWCGVLGVPRDWCATVGMDGDTGIGWAGGYVGLGVSTSNFSGQTLADLVLEKTTERTGLPWVNRKPRKWEVEPFRWLGVHGMYWLYHKADRNEMRDGGRETSRLATWANRLTGR
ncbi:FAD-binding oxidoreductase [Xinfangfangia sp. CPCC 101601]|uniref:FAD-binding oxidoreductase n=1 Tax=Pseudogemmobacter lacusdianii TaxID=3069608 RepID=A0ABU0W2P2_9RHOB|nr:FAD-binding oxidoreductase [Xinfangfangia sp. CPCC 101601]MDQ2068183.1 FAD-binding oxidoreductase [Xinfangfangia sp. CPCC 101601]